MPVILDINPAVEGEAEPIMQTYNVVVVPNNIVIRHRPIAYPIYLALFALGQCAYYYSNLYVFDHHGLKDGSDYSFWMGVFGMMVYYLILIKCAFPEHHPDRISEYFIPQSIEHRTGYDVLFLFSIMINVYTQIILIPFNGEHCARHNEDACNGLTIAWWCEFAITHFVFASLYVYRTYVKLN